MRVTAAELSDCLDRLPTPSRVDAPFVRIVVRGPATVFEEPPREPTMNVPRDLTFHKKDFHAKGRKSWVEWELEVLP